MLKKKKRTIAVIGIVVVLGIGFAVVKLLGGDGPESIPNVAIEPGMILVEGGTFKMGEWNPFSFPVSVSNAKDPHNKHGRDFTFDAEHIHDVTVDSFLISKYEVTFEEFDRFCEATGRELKPDGGWGRGKQAAIYISWPDAVAYCNWRSGQEGFEPCYDLSGDVPLCNFNADGYRLLTEAEWEYAAKGGQKMDPSVNEGHGHVFAGTSSSKKKGMREYIRFCPSMKKKDYHHPWPVGQKNPNELGIHDMSGNVWEWCWDWYHPDYYKESPDTNPTGPEPAKAYHAHVLRGGSWYNYPIFLRTSFRFFSQRQHMEKDKDYSNNRIGFRVCRTVTES